MKAQIESAAQRLSKRLRKKQIKAPGKRKQVWQCELLPMRKSLNLTLRNISAGAGVSIAVLSAIEHGTDPMLTTARAIAGFFGCTVEEMWPEKLTS